VLRRSESLAPPFSRSPRAPDAPRSRILELVFRWSRGWKQGLIAGVLVVVSALAAACSPAGARPASPIIHLHDLQPLPTPADRNIKPLRVAVASIVSPQGTLDSYSPLLKYLSAQLGRPVELVQRRTYQEVNNLIASGEIDMAFVCTRAYVVGHREFGMELLAAPQVDGQQVYYAYLIVPADSPYQTLEDLRGKVFAFTDPLSNTGYTYPVALLKSKGETPEHFFARYFFTYSHDNAIRAVAEGLADGASVDSIVYTYAIRRDPSLAARTRIIAKSRPFGMPPVVVSPKIRPQTKALLQSILLGMYEDPAGQEALTHLGFDRFVPVKDADYDSVRALEHETARP